MYNTLVPALAHERQTERLRQSAQHHLATRARRGRLGPSTWPRVRTSRLEV